MITISPYIKRAGIHVLLKRRPQKEFATFSLQFSIMTNLYQLIIIGTQGRIIDALWFYIAEIEHIEFSIFFTTDRVRNRKQNALVSSKRGTKCGSQS